MKIAHVQITYAVFTQVTIYSQILTPVAFTYHGSSSSGSYTMLSSEQPDQLSQVVDITVAIPTYNGAQKLPMVLERLRSQTHLTDLRWEIIVCDNGSTDNTAEVIRSYQSEWPSEYPLHYRFAAEQGSAFARQYAIDTAAGDLIAFLDDDNLPDPNWVSQAYKFALAHPQAGAFGSQIHGKFETELPEDLEKIKCFLAIIERGAQPHLYEPSTKMLPPAAGLVVRKQAWENAVPRRLFLNNKGKAAGLASEDLEANLYIQKAGWEVWYNPDMVVCHDIPNERLQKAYLMTLLECVGLSRYHIRLLGLEKWKKPLFVPAYMANDIRKLVLHRLRHGQQAKLNTPESCQRSILSSTIVSPFFLLRKAYQDKLQAQDDAQYGDRAHWLNQITRAFEQNQFALYQQPVIVVDPSNRSDPGQKELLLRLCNEQNEYILPSNFLPTAQRYGLMRTIDRWVIRHLFKKIASQPPQSVASYLDGSPLYSINLSAESVQDPSFVSFIANTISNAHLSPDLFCFEISVKTAIALPTQTQNLVAALHQLGCQITLDDVSFTQTPALSREITSLLAHLPIEYIKLSSSMMDARSVADRSAWVQMKELMSEHGVQAIAKGVESQATLEAVQAQGIRYAQGYQTGRPQLLT